MGAMAPGVNIAHGIGTTGQAHLSALVALLPPPFWRFSLLVPTNNDASVVVQPMADELPDAEFNVRSPGVSGRIGASEIVCLLERRLLRLYEGLLEGVVV